MTNDVKQIFVLFTPYYFSFWSISTNNVFSILKLYTFLLSVVIFIYPDYQSLIRYVFGTFSPSLSVVISIG